MVDVGEIFGPPPSPPSVATSHHALLGYDGEPCLRNPLREICTAEVCEGEIPKGYGRPKRARSRKRRTQPRKTYRLSGSPLLGHSNRRQWRCNSSELNSSGEPRDGPQFELGC